MPADVRELLRPRLRKHPERVRELEAIIARTGTLLPRDYWAPHCLLGNWTGGSMGAFLRHYPRYFGDLPGARRGPDRQRGPHDDPVVRRHPAGVLDVTSHYFEFIPEEEMEVRNRRC